MNDKKILITGATGAIGGEALKQLYDKQEASSISVFVRPSKKAKKLVRTYPGVQVFYGSITDSEAVAKACTNQDYVIHLAAIIPPLADDKPEMARAVNVEGTRNVVKGMEANAPNAFLLYSSSVAIYGDRNKNPDIKTTDELKPSVGDDYGQTKVEAEKIIRESKINWTIYRLSAIMGIGNHKVSKLMFHMPLETVMEIATVRDTARAFVNSIGKEAQLEKKTFNLGGGETCRITYIDFMTRAFDLYGMGKIDFPKYAFAKINFHCGNYVDGHLLEEIVHFRQDTIDTYFERFGKAVPGIQRFFTKLVNKPVKMYLTKLSEPLIAHKKQDKEMIARFFGSEYDA
jgi:nucleoside-diphosphate-sugar epimerase